MNLAPTEIQALARQVAQAEATLQRLEWEIVEIGQPTAHDLHRHLGVLKIEQRVLRRNLTEALGMDEPKDMAKIDALLAHLHREEDDDDQQTGLFHHSPTATLRSSTRASLRIAKLCVKAVKRIFGEHAKPQMPVAPSKH